MNAKSEAILAALRRGNESERRALLQAMPETPMRDSVASLLEGNVPEGQVIALSALVTAYGFGLAAEFAGDLARAAYPYARDVYAAQGAGGPLQLPTVSAIVSGGLHALNLMGRYSESVAFADEVVPDLEALHDDANLPDILAHAIEALVYLHRMEDARRLLARAELLPRQSVHLPRLRALIETLIRPPSELPPATTAHALSEEEYRRLDTALREGERFLTQAGGEMNEWQAHASLRSVGQLFLDETKGRDPARLAEALGVLRPVEAWARARGHTEVHNDSLWELYLAHSRLGASSAAADALLALRRNIERTRAGIADPLERAGAGAKYPYLYPALCQMLMKSDRIEALLGAIEAAKGRVVADVLAQRVHRLVDEADFAAPAARLGDLMRRHRAHYLSYFVDDDDTLAVLVAKDGSLHASGAIPLGKEQIRSAARYADPRTWGEPNLADLTGPPVANIAEVLEPLVAWLEPHVASGLIEAGDHICYSPDELLHQLPLAYVAFEGAPLVRRFSISRTHGAAALALLLERELPRPRAFTGVEVPGRQDRADESMLSQLRAADAWLAERLPGITYRDEQATLVAIGAADLAGRVVHFATHGTFPLDDGRPAQSPFVHSGLALAGADGLPDKGCLARGEGDVALLTPEWALAAGLDLSGSHVTLQACVTGLAREGIGGDALGLDWAFVQLGASSLLASHWQVSAALSTAFFLRFYRYWLAEGQSRGSAWRQAILSMMAEPGQLAAPYAWAAFSLSGDWR